MIKYIDADKAIEVCDWYEHEFCECENYIRTIAEDIRHLPAADVQEVKHGRWIIDRKFGNDVMSDEQMVICSVCGKGIFYGKQNYCPNCGAKMDEVEE